MDLNADKLLRLLFLERERVKELGEKIQAATRSHELPRLRCIIGEIRQRVEVREAQLAALQTAENELIKSRAELEIRGEQERQLRLTRQTLAKTSNELQGVKEDLEKITERETRLKLQLNRASETEGELNEQLSAKADERDSLREQLAQLLTERADFEGRARDFETIQEALFKGQEEYRRQRLEIAELQNSLRDARAYGEELQKQLQEREREKEVPQELLRAYISAFLNTSTAKHHALLYREICEGALLNNHEELDFLRGELHEAQSHLAKRLKQATLLQESMDQERMRAGAAEERLNEANQEASELRLHKQVADQKLAAAEAERNQAVEAYEKLRGQYEQLSTTFNTIRQSLGGLGTT